jgi:hypothetical protein
VTVLVYVEQWQRAIELSRTLRLGQTISPEDARAMGPVPIGELASRLRYRGMALLRLGSEGFMVVTNVIPQFGQA